MRVTSCPICGCKPIIVECAPLKNNLRRRMCSCPKFDSVIPWVGFNRPWFIYVGEGDDNSIFKLWNIAIKRYQENKPKDWFERDYSRWTDDSHIHW